MFVVNERWRCWWLKHDMHDMKYAVSVLQTMALINSRRRSWETGFQIPLETFPLHEWIIEGQWYVSIHRHVLYVCFKRCVSQCQWSIKEINLTINIASRSTNKNWFLPWCGWWCWSNWSGLVKSWGKWWSGSKSPRIVSMSQGPSVSRDVVDVCPPRSPSPSPSDPFPGPQSTSRNFRSVLDNSLNCGDPAADDDDDDDDADDDDEAWCATWRDAKEVEKKQKICFHYSCVHSFCLCWCSYRLCCCRYYNYNLNWLLKSEGIVLKC